MGKKLVYGLCVFPFIPIFIYFFDVYFFSSFFVRLTQEVCLTLGLDKHHGEYNFYNYPFNRTVYFISVFLSPFIVTYWYMCADTHKFKYEEGLKGLAKCMGYVVVLLMMLLFWFLPVTLGDNPSNKMMSVIHTHQHPIPFLIFIYWFLFFCFMYFGLMAKYFYCYVRRGYIE